MLLSRQRSALARVSLLLPLLLLLLFTACAPRAVSPPSANAASPVSAVPTADPSGTPGTLPEGTRLEPSAPLSASQAAWVESTLASLPLRERVAQLMMIWVLGDYSSTSDSAMIRVAHEVSTLGVGGLVMSLGSPIEVAAKVNYLQGLAQVPLLVASDVEPGLGRLEGGVFATSALSAGTATVLPSNMAIGAGGRESDAEAAGRVTGREARAIGIHLAFAPTSDVNNNPRNPVINTRSFGEQPDQVGRLTAAFVRGLQAGGAAATLKHFPGHGDTDVDSHLGLPVISVDRARLDAVELVPFRAGIAAGAAAVMTAHIALPAAYGDSTPATLSHRIMSGLLRDTLGFRGLTVTDAMTMEGVAKGYGVGESAVRAVQAGDDILLMPVDVRVAIDAIVAAVGDGRLSAQQVDASVRRILELKVRTGAVAHPQVSLEALRQTVGSAEHQQVARDIAARGMTLLRDGGGQLPVPAGARTLLVLYAPDSDVLAGSSFAATFAARVKATRTVRVSPRTGRAELDSLAATAETMDRVVIYTYTRTLEGAGRLAIAPAVASFIETLATHRAPIVVAGGNPYVISQFPAVTTYLVTFGRGDALETAAARAITGQATIGGHAPVSLPGFFRAGDGVVRPATGSAP